MPVFRAAVHTDQGLRENLEDCARAWLVQDAVSSTQVAVCEVLDGVGGNNRGEVASATAAEEIAATVIGQLAARRMGQSESTHDDTLALLRQAFIRANQAILTAAAAGRECQGMATTAVCAVLIGEYAYLAWVGDSRAYLFRRGLLQRLTRDHTEVSELLECGLLDPADAAWHSGAHTLTRYIGQRTGFAPETRLVRLHPDDLLLECSDGLTEVLSDESIAAFIDAYLQDERDIERLPLALVRQALIHGTTDNVTALCCQGWSAAPQTIDLDRTATGAYRLRRAQITQSLFSEAC